MEGPQQVWRISDAPEGAKRLWVKHMFWGMYDILGVKCYDMWWTYGGGEVDVRKYVPQLLSDKEEIYEFRRYIMLLQKEKRQEIILWYVFIFTWMDGILKKANPIR